jgi:hypothetical protein
MAYTNIEGDRQVLKVFAPTSPKGMDGSNRRSAGDAFAPGTRAFLKDVNSVNAYLQKEALGSRVKTGSSPVAQDKSGVWSALCASVVRCTAGAKELRASYIAMVAGFNYSEEGGQKIVHILEHI